MHVHRRPDGRNAAGRFNAQHGSIDPTRAMGLKPHDLQENGSDLTASVSFFPFPRWGMISKTSRLAVETVLEKQLAVRLDGTDVVAIALRSRDATLVRGWFTGAGAGVNCRAADHWI